MVTLTRDPSEVLIQSAVQRSQMVTLLDEMIVAIDAAPLRPVAASASNVTVVAADIGKLFLQTATSTISLLAAATAGNGFTIYVQANGGAVTLDPNGSEQINGAATLVLSDGEAAIVTCTGTAWRAIVVTTLGSLGSAASEDVGTAIGDVVQLVNVGGVAGLPAVSGANLTDIAAWTELAVTATTSGTAIDFTSLPSGIREIEIWFDRVSFNGSDDLLVQIGTGGVPTTSGYQAGSGTAANVASAAGFPVYMADASHSASGLMRLYQIDTNDWLSSHSIFMRPSDGLSVPGGGSVTLAGTLDNIRITSIAGTQAFDAGQIRVRYR